MPSGVDQNHIAILSALRKAGVDPLKTSDVHSFARFGPTPSVEGVGRRLKTLETRGWVRRADYDNGAAWALTELGTSALSDMGL